MAPKKKPYSQLSPAGKSLRRSKKARDAKAKTDKAYNAKPENVKKRVEANRGRTAAKKRGVDVKGKQYDHAANGGKGGMVKRETNQGRRGEGNRKPGKRGKYKKHR